MTYWDSSALLKLYIVETDSLYFRSLASQSLRPLLTADIAKEEILCALHRKEAEANLSLGGAKVLFQTFEQNTKTGKIILIPRGIDVLNKLETILARTYEQIPSLFIRTLDGIHIASALTSKAKTIVATDKRLREVALLMGFTVLPKEST